MAKYSYNGGLSAETIDGREYVLACGNAYELNPALTRVKTLVKLGFLTELKEAKKQERAKNARSNN